VGRSALSATALVAPDSFKGTLGARVVAEAIARGCESAGVAVDLCPMADGGEGTAEVLLGACGGERIAVPAHDPLGWPIEGEIALLADGRRAVVEVACASGLALLEVAEQDPWIASSYGTGELIAAAAMRGAREVLVAAGGSATVDGGRGAIEALRQEPAIADLSLLVLCDVETTWESCAALYGPQKGADGRLAAKLAQRLAELAGALPRDPRGVPMGGAAGGLAGGLWAAFGARLLQGASFVCDAVGIQERLRSASYALTGEGRLDDQSSMGKIVGSLARQALAAGVSLHAIVGCDARRPGFVLPGLDLVLEAGTPAAIEQAAHQIALTSAPEQE
jgi:glycerate 2-kinase